MSLIYIGKSKHGNDVWLPESAIGTVEVRSTGLHPTRGEVWTALVYTVRPNPDSNEVIPFLCYGEDERDAFMRKINAQMDRGHCQRTYVMPDGYVVVAQLTHEGVIVDLFDDEGNCHDTFARCAQEFFS